MDYPQWIYDAFSEYFNDKNNWFRDKLKMRKMLLTYGIDFEYDTKEHRNEWVVVKGEK